MSITPVYVFAKWQVKEGQLATVLSFLRQAAQKSRSETGNLFYHLHQSTSDDNTILIYEGYTNEAAAAAHRNADHYQEIIVKSIIPLLENREVIVMKPLSE